MEFKPIRQEHKEALPGYAKFEGGDPEYVTGYKEVGGRFVPAVSTRLSARDRLGDWGVRWDIGRNDYKVAPGLYAVGDPDPSSPLLVTANYKLSFDRLRMELGGIDAWIVVLDTKGVNVWCAAGKGSFGTAELLDKIERLRLGEIVSHKVLILPQLGAPGVSAPEIARVSRFRPIWGPVRAADLPAFIAAGMKKTDAMRLVQFRLADRMAIAPVELAHAWPFLLGAVVLSLLGALPFSQGFSHRVGGLVAVTFGSILAGSLAFPALLPFLPTKAFSVKGAMLGALWGIACAIGGSMSFGLSAAAILASAAVSSFISLNFTGSSTFTCQPGANAEVEKSIIPMIASLGAGIILGACARIFGF
ncbi:MAG: mercury methylation corrinoid protein HgcA [Rectinemataceae bacterium]|jgi:hypothetical protein